MMISPNKAVRIYSPAEAKTVVEYYEDRGIKRTGTSFVAYAEEFPVIAVSGDQFCGWRSHSFPGDIVEYDEWERLVGIAAPEFEIEDSEFFYTLFDVGCGV